MKIKSIILTCFTLLLANDISFAENEQKNIRQECSNEDEHFVTRLKFSLKILLQTLQLINAENPTHFSIKLLNTVCAQVEYVIVEHVIVEDIMKTNINSPFVPYKDDFIINHWKNVKKEWYEIINNNYYKSPDLKKLFERHHCDMTGMFERWEK